MYTYNFPLTFVVVVAFLYVVVFLSFDFVWYKCRLVLCKKIDFEEETISLKQIKSKSKSNKEIINGQCHWLMGLVITLHRPYERTVTYIFRSFRSLWVENSSSLARYRNPV